MLPSLADAPPTPVSPLGSVSAAHSHPQYRTSLYKVFEQHPAQWFPAPRLFNLPALRVCGPPSSLLCKSLIPQIT